MRVSFTEMKTYARVLGAAGVTRPLNKIISKRHMAFMEHINSGGGIEKLVVCGKLLGTSSSGLGLKKLVAGRKRAYTTPNNCLMIKGGHQH